MGNNVFISFKSEDRNVILPLYDRLRKEGINVFMSSEDLNFGEKWTERLGQELRNTKVLIAFVTENYLHNHYQVERELGMADNRKIPILTVLYGIRPGEIPSGWEYLLSRQMIPTNVLTDTIIAKIVGACKAIMEGKTVVGKSAKDVFFDGMELFKQGDYISAIRQFEKAADEFPYSYVMMVLSRLQLHQYQGAREAAREAQKRCPMEPDAFFVAALSNLAGREEYTSKILERATEQLQHASELQFKLQHSYLACILAYLYERRSYMVPRIILSLIEEGKKYDFDENQFDEIRGLVGV